MSTIHALIVLGRAKGIIGITAGMSSEVEPTPEPVSGTGHVWRDPQQQQQQGSRYSAEHIRQQQSQQQGQ